MSAHSKADAGRVVLITGAGKGLGRAFAEYWASRGARIVVNNRRREGDASSADEVVAAIGAAGGEAIADHHDISEEGAACAMVEAALGAWGRLDALILNASVSGPAAYLSDMPKQVFRDVLEVNFFANVEIVQAALPHLKKAHAARILFIASTAGLYGVRGRSTYAASKGALIALALSLADELSRDGVGVNVVAPYAATQMTSAALGANPTLAQRMSVEKVAPFAAWLTSSVCEVNGEIWLCGGGFARRARMLEGGGGAWPADIDVFEWLPANIERLQDMSGAQGFLGAEAAFAQFAALASPRPEAQEERPGRDQ